MIIMVMMMSSIPFSLISEWLSIKRIRCSTKEKY